MLGFASVLRAFRARSSLPLSANEKYLDNQNADLSCDVSGALWVQLAPSSVISTGGAFGIPESFTTGLVNTPVVISATQSSLQQLNAFALVENTYLHVFNRLVAPVNGNVPRYSFPCPLNQGVNISVGFPYGLFCSLGIYIAFSSTPSILTLGPSGWAQGVYTHP